MWHLAKSRLIWHQENVRGAARAREMSPCGGSVVRRSPGPAHSHVSMDAHMTLCKVHTQYCTYVCAQMGRKKYGRSVPLAFSNLYLKILTYSHTQTQTHTTVSGRPSSAPLIFFPPPPLFECFADVCVGEGLKCCEHRWLRRMINRYIQAQMWMLHLPPLNISCIHKHKCSSRPYLYIFFVKDKQNPTQIFVFFPLSFFFVLPPFVFFPLRCLFSWTHLSTCHFQSVTSSFPHHGLTLRCVSEPWHTMMKRLLFFPLHVAKHF